MAEPGREPLPFRYQSRGRTVSSLVFLGLGAAMIALAWTTGAGQLIYLPLGLFTAAQLYLLARDPRAGMDIEADAVALWRGRRRETIPTAEIDHVQIQHWSDSTDVIVHRRDGGRIEVAARCVPGLGAMKRALKAAGVPVREG